MADQSLDSIVQQLEVRAGNLLGLVQNSSRPFVIEFAGTPKSGKSTSVEAIRHFFTRQGFRVNVLEERAALCPIPMKGHLFFNTSTTMLAQLLANVETPADIVIIDRGLFDALVWHSLQRQRGELTAAEAETIEAFLLLQRWRELIDLPVVMSVSGEEAIARENSARVSHKPGSIMNMDVLSALAEAVEAAVLKYGSRFRGIVEYSTSGRDTRASNADLVGKILDKLEEFADPEILVLPRDALDGISLTNGGQFSEDTSNILAERIEADGKFLKRSIVENDNKYIQIVACGILTRDSGVFIFERKERDPKYKLYGKSTIWQGCHVPVGVNGPKVPLIENALVERITRSLFLSRAFPIKLLGYCWEKNDPQDNRHLGIMFRVNIDNEHTALDLRRKEFRSGRGHGLSGGFVPMEMLVEKRNELSFEQWSMTTLRDAAELLRK
jgi:predicted NUDIX family phosphoesterase